MTFKTGFLIHFMKPWWKMCVCERFLWPPSVAFVPIAWQFLKCIILLFPHLKQLKRSGFSVCVYGPNRIQFSVSLMLCFWLLVLLERIILYLRHLFKTRLNQLPWIFSSHNPENCDRPFEVSPVCANIICHERFVLSNQIVTQGGVQACFPHLSWAAGAKGKLPRIKH